MFASWTTQAKITKRFEKFDVDKSGGLSPDQVCVCVCVCVVFVQHVVCASVAQLRNLPLAPPL